MEDYIFREHAIKSEYPPKMKNIEKQHIIPIGALVEIIRERDDAKGLRLFVVSHDFETGEYDHRYSLSFKKEAGELLREETNDLRFLLNNDKKNSTYLSDVESIKKLIKIHKAGLLRGYSEKEILVIERQV